MKRWSTDDTAMLQGVAATGELPDGRVATQERLAALLGFTRRTIAEHCRLMGLQLPRSRERMSEGGRNSAYRRQLIRLRVISMAKAPRA